MEFIILKKNGEQVFEKHVKELGEKTAEERGGIVSEDYRSSLILSYPVPEMENNEFKKFFSSPDYCNKYSDSFYGCFAVELTNYIRNAESRKLGELFGYMNDRKEIAFVLFAVDDGNGEADKLAEKVSRKTGCKVGKAFAEGIEWKAASDKTSRSFGY